MFDDFEDIENELSNDMFGTNAYEPEEPEGLLSPRDSSLFVGHSSNEKILLDFINSGAMPHALIFSGQEGIGKATMAFRLARYLLKNGTPDSAQDSLFGDTPAAATSLDIPADDPVFSKVSSGGHPDLLTIERGIDAKKGTQKNSVDVETARKVAPFLRMTASNGGWRVVIIDDADTMNRNAQNAMLKILEEPPSNTLLILIVHRLGAMIPTIRSRCRVLNFEPLAEDCLNQLMEKQIGNSLDNSQKQLLNALAAGSVGRAQQIIDSNGLETAQSILDLFQQYPNFNWVDIHHLSDQAGRAGQDSTFNHIEKTFLWVIESFVFALANHNQTLPAVLDTPPLTDMMKSRPLDQWLKIFEELKAHFEQTNFSNLDKRQAVLGAFNFLTN
ncbi:MAG TPA: DNA polymerase III subunit delta' [Alphaproteobacteria bacterium]|nr:DNA polymerase III subunit delta' [Alphaproteobacteria bacterium]